MFSFKKNIIKCTMLVEILSFEWKLHPRSEAVVRPTEGEVVEHEANTTTNGAS